MDVWDVLHYLSESHQHTTGVMVLPLGRMEMERIAETDGRGLQKSCSLQGRRRASRF